MNNGSKSYKGCAWSLIGAILIGIIMLFMQSCKSVEYVEVPVIHTDTIYQSKVVHDSIYHHDSITIKEKGDSVWIERWNTKYKLLELHDTIYQATHDTIAKPYPIIEYEAKPLTWWQQTRLYLANILILAIVILLILYIIKRKFLK